MINPIFDSFLKEYFETFFKTGKRFPQSIIFEGSDTLYSYFFSLELSRILNCSLNQDKDCSCTNCKWIKEGNHPSVISVTPLDFKEDSTKTVISVKQIEKITSIINISSDYHRFFIFSDVKSSSLSEKEKNNLKKFNHEGFLIPKENWYPYPLNKKIMQDEASNALLKSVEEAPDKVTFVFLCNSKEDIISTIVSRSNVFQVPVQYEKSSIDIVEFLSGYPDFKIEEGIEKIQKIIDMSQEKNIDMIDILNSFQEYLYSLMEINPNMGNLILEDIKKIQLAKKQIKALVAPYYALESLFISLSKEGRNL